MNNLGLFLLLAAGLAIAQQESPQQSAQSAGSAQSSAQRTEVGKPTDTDEPLFEGCLAGSKDNYTLTEENGQTFRLHSDKDLREHVGNMVEIRGMVKKEGIDKPASATTAAQHEIDVADIKVVSKGCSRSPREKDSNY